MPLSSDGLLGRIFKVQSCNYCFPMKSLLGKDCKLAYREFSDFFLFFEHLKKYGLPRTELGPAIKPHNVWSPAFGRHLIPVVEREKMEINIFVTYAVAQEILYLVFVLMQIGNYQLSLVIIFLN